MAGTQIAARHAADKIRELRGSSRTSLKSPVERRSQPSQHFGAGAPFPPHGSLAALSEPRSVIVNGSEQLQHARASDANRRQNRNGTTVTRVREVERRAEETLRIFRPWLVRLVDGNDVGDLEQAGLDRLNPVAESRGLHNQYSVSKRCDIGTVLARANGLDENQRVANRVK
jgi:hypothetical protein